MTKKGLYLEFKKGFLTATLDGADMTVKVVPFEKDNEQMYNVIDMNGKELNTDRYQNPHKHWYPALSAASAVLNEAKRKNKSVAPEIKVKVTKPKTSASSDKPKTTAKKATPSKSKGVKVTTKGKTTTVTGDSKKVVKAVNKLVEETLNGK